MNKSQKLYSQMIAGALVVSAVVAPTAVGAEETAPKVSDKPSGGKATNNVTLKDTVKVQGVKVGDTVKVYADAGKTELIGKATAKSTSVDITISKKLPFSKEAGKVYATRMAKGETESETVEITVDAEATTLKIEDANVEVFNNVKAADTVVVKGVKAKEKVNVYADEAKTILIGKGVGKGGDLTIKIGKKFQTKTTKLDTPEKVYVTLTSVNMLESDSYSEEVPEEKLTKISTTPTPGDSDDVEITKVTVTNSDKKNGDRVKFEGVKEKDEVIVYLDEKKETILGKGKVKKGSTSIEIKIKGDLSDHLKNTDGTLKDFYYSIKRGDFHPSVATLTGTSAADLAVKPSDNGKLEASATASNTTKKDTIAFKNLEPKAVVNVYASPEATETKGALLGTAKVKKDGTAVVNIKGGFAKNDSDSNTNVLAKKVKLTIKTEGMLESAAVDKEIPEETESVPPTIAEGDVKNNVVTKDTVTVKGLLANDIVTVYADAKKETVLGTAKAKDGQAVVTLKNGFTPSGDAERSATATYDNIHVTVTSKDLAESPTVSTPVPVEPTSKTLNSADVALTNNVTIEDVLTVKNIAAKDVVTVYKGETVIGQATAKDKTVTIELSEQVKKDEIISIKLTEYDKYEGDAYEHTAGSEAISATLKASQVKTTNNLADGVKDTLTVTGLQKKDVIKVYSDEAKTTLIGTATSKGDEVVVTLTEDFKETPVYVALTSDNKIEGTALPVTPAAPVKSTKLASTQITVTNNVDSKDVVTVTGVKKGETIKVYADESATAPLKTFVATGTTAKIELDAQLTEETTGENAYNPVYVTRTAVNETESDRVSAKVGKEEVTAKLAKTNVQLVNNVDAELKDTVTVTGVVKGDVVSISSDEAGKTVVGTATATGSSVTIELEAGFTEVGTTNEFNPVFITKKNVNKRPSAPLELTPPAQAVSADLKDGSAKVTNNEGANDTVTVTGVVAGDVVKVYDAATGTTVLGTATVPAKATTVTVELEAALANTATKVFVSRTSTNKLESEGRVEATVASEAKAVTFDVINNVTSDYVNVKAGVKAGDIVNIYDATGKAVLGTATVATVPSETAPLKVTLTKNLVAAGGTIYVGVSAEGANEGEKVEFEYAGEAQSGKLATDEFALKPESLTAADSVAVGSIIKLYKAGATTPLHTLTVAADAKELKFETGKELTAGDYELTVTDPANTTSGEEYTESERLAVEVKQTVEPSNVVLLGNGTGFVIKGLKEAVDYTITGPSSFEATGKLTAEQATAAATTGVTLAEGLTVNAAGEYTIVVKADGKTASAPVKFTVEQVAKFDGTATANASDLTKVTLTGVSSSQKVELYDGETKVAGTYDAATKVFTANVALTEEKAYNVVLLDTAGKYLRSTGVSFTTPKATVVDPAV